MILKVSVMGCDDTTCFAIECTETEKNFLDRFIELCNRSSKSGCQPTIALDDEYWVLLEEDDE